MLSIFMRLRENRQREKGRPGEDRGRDWSDAPKHQGMNGRDKEGFSPRVSEGVQPN